jgi:hypothetical protein
MNRKQTSLTLSPETTAALQDLSTTLGLSMSRLVDEAVRMYAERMGKPKDNTDEVFCRRAGCYNLANFSTGACDRHG